MRERKGARQGREDLFLRLTAVQLVCCGLILLLVFAAMKHGGALFSGMYAEFRALMAKDIDMGSFRLFDFGSANEKRRDTLPAEETEESAEAQLPNEENGGAWAGGADLSAEEAAGALSFAFYTADSAVVMPVNGRETSAFGERVHPVYGTVGFHSGKDIAAPEGTPVHAAMDGVVIAVGVGANSGNYVKLRHENGVETLYCHLHAANVEKNVAVRRGDVIGFVGQTGLATGPHLHFEVQMDGVKRDPDFLLEGAAVVD